MNSFFRVVHKNGCNKFSGSLGVLLIALGIFVGWAQMSSEQALVSVRC